MLKRYSAQQAEDIWDQLLYGIRYLDFRVSYHQNTAEKFWLNHDLVQMNPLYKAIQVHYQVNNFYRKHNQHAVQTFQYVYKYF